MVNEKKCTHCEESTTDWIVYTNSTDNEVYCETCYDELFAACERCDTVVSIEDISSVIYTEYYPRNTAMWCDDCSDNYSFNCTGCSETFDDRVGHSTFNDMYCSDCHGDTFSYCEGCSDTVYTDDARYCEDCRTDFCDNCSCECNGEVNPSNSQYCTNTRGNIVRTLRYIGIEAEVEHKDYDNSEALTATVPSQVQTVSDGSLGCYGREIVTPPANGEALERLIDDITTAASNCGYGVSTRCGLHVHVDMTDVRDLPIDESNEVLYRLFKLVYACEPLLYAIIAASRRTGTYSVPLRGSYTYNNWPAEVPMKVKWYGSRNGCGNDRYDDTRYHGLNLNSYYYRGTVEFRYHHGTICPVKIKRWCELVSSLVEYAINNDNETAIPAIDNLLNCSLGQSVTQLANMIGLTAETVNWIFERMDKFSHPIESLPQVPEHIPEYANRLSELLNQERIEQAARAEREIAFEEECTQQRERQNALETLIAETEIIQCESFPPIDVDEDSVHVLYILHDSNVTNMAFVTCEQAFTLLNSDNVAEGTILENHMIEDNEPIREVAIRVVDMWRHEFSGYIHFNVDRALAQLDYNLAMNGGL